MDPLHLSVTWLGVDPRMDIQNPRAEKRLPMSSKFVDFLDAVININGGTYMAV